MKVKTKPQPEASAEVSFADRIKQVCAEAGDVVEAEAQRIKASPEGELLPIDWLRHNVRAVTKGGSCNCKVALKLLEQKQ